MTILVHGGFFLVWNDAKRFLKSLTLTWSLLVWSGRYFCVKSFISRDISQHDHLVHTYKIDLEWMSFCKELHLKTCKKVKSNNIWILHLNFLECSISNCTRRNGSKSTLWRGRKNKESCGACNQLIPAECFHKATRTTSRKPLTC